METENYSGKLLIRVPKYIHKLLIEKAKEEGCSVNQLIQTYISLGLGSTQVAETMAEYVVDNRVAKRNDLNNRLKEIEKEIDNDELWDEADDVLDEMKKIVSEVIDGKI